jgi:hypothetical protein
MIDRAGRLALYTSPKTDPARSEQLLSSSLSQERVTASGSQGNGPPACFGFLLFKVPVRMRQCSRTHEAS